MRSSRARVTVPIAEGRTAQIYESAPGRIVKLFHTGYPRDRVEHEARVTALARAAGAPAPLVYGQAERDGRLGIELERFVGPLLLEAVLAEPARVVELARRMARVHAALHRLPATEEFPSLVTRLRDRIVSAPALCEATRADLLRRLEEARAGRALCHGDFHPANLVVDAETIRVIDWCDATAGPPEADVARSLLIMDLAAGGATSRLAPAARALVGGFREAYAAEYASVTARSGEAIARWTPFVAAARLCERIAGEESLLLALARDTGSDKPSQA